MRIDNKQLKKKKNWKRKYCRIEKRLKNSLSHLRLRAARAKKIVRKRNANESWTEIIFLFWFISTWNEHIFIIKAVLFYTFFPCCSLHFVIDSFLFEPNKHVSLDSSLQPFFSALEYWHCWLCAPPSYATFALVRRKQTKWKFPESFTLFSFFPFFLRLFSYSHIIAVIYIFLSAILTKTFMIEANESSRSLSLALRADGVMLRILVKLSYCI